MVWLRKLNFQLTKLTSSFLNGWATSCSMNQCSTLYSMPEINGWGKEVSLCLTELRCLLLLWMMDCTTIKNLLVFVNIEFLERCLRSQYEMHAEVGNVWANRWSDQPRWHAFGRKDLLLGRPWESSSSRTRLYKGLQTLNTLQWKTTWHCKLVWLLLRPR